MKATFKPPAPASVKNSEKKATKSKSESLPKVVNQSPSVESIEKMFQMLNKTTKSNVDEDVESFYNHISLKLQKVPVGEQREILFAEINRLILETLYPKVLLLHILVHLTVTKVLFHPHINPSNPP